ncbi:MAG: hypothetical protein AAF219_04960 [Myxococcota bacterium]
MIDGLPLKGVELSGEQVAMLPVMPKRKPKATKRRRKRRQPRGVERGIAEIKIGRFDVAGSELKRALRLDPTDVDARAAYDRVKASSK